MLGVIHFSQTSGKFEFTMTGKNTEPVSSSPQRVTYK